jgi:flavin-dependent dehydrogenase
MGLSIQMADCYSEVMIIGGGVAGLSCLNALLDYGINATLIEASTVGTPKMCGEFLAPPAVELLQKWGFNAIQTISRMEFMTDKKQLNIELSKPAGGFSRGEAERLLAARAIKLGGIIKENTAITDLIPATARSGYRLTLSTNQTYKTPTAIFATGKFGLLKRPSHFPYVGFKLHLDHIIEHRKLYMFSAKNAYLGMVPISETQSNCTCLMRRSYNTDVDSKDFYKLLHESKILSDLFQDLDMEKHKWLISEAPEFLLKKNPDWPNAYWIGDALAGIHPAIGSGFYHAIQTGVLAATAYASKSINLYQQSLSKSLHKRLKIGKLMHQLLLNPTLGNLAIPIAKTNPWLVNWLLHSIEYT